MEKPVKKSLPLPSYPLIQRLLTRFLLGLALLLSAGCSGQMPSQASQLGKAFPHLAITPTPFRPLTATPQPVPQQSPTGTFTPSPSPSPTPQPPPTLSMWLDSSLPPTLREAIHLPAGVSLAPDQESATLVLGAVRGGPPLQSHWVYALVAPFPTVIDDVSLADIQAAWRGSPFAPLSGKPILLSETTRAALTAWWGPAAEEGVRVMPAGQLLDTAWQEMPAWAIVPFEDIQPRWKVLRVNGISPLDREFDIQAYPLVIWFGVNGSEAALNGLQEKLPLPEAGPAVYPGLFPASNRDPQKLTVLVMTGVTALARATAAKMDTLGVTYPASDIHDWLYNADLLHISNEVSFNPDCPLANPMATSMMFCSRPEYIQLLDYIGTDIVELSGNHNNDWGREAFTYSLDLYHERGWKIFAGGANLDEAAQPALVEHNGHRLAFIGCNPVGPEWVFATPKEPGVLQCNMSKMVDTVKELRAQNYMPIVTFQYNEYYQFKPSETQQRDFRKMADAGALIVSGSQAHFPQTLEFYADTVIHYGLGNLFFDQMNIPVVGTRREFIDRHVFYDGRYLGVELLTAMLEDYARPRPMTTEERQSMLIDMFVAAGWWK